MVWARGLKAGRIAGAVGLDQELEQKVDRLTFCEGCDVVPMLWLRKAPDDVPRNRAVTPSQVLAPFADQQPSSTTLVSHSSASGVNSQASWASKM